MAFITKKRIGGRDYYYLVENKRVGGAVKQSILEYYGAEKPVRGRGVERAFSLTKTEAVFDVGHALALYRIIKEFNLASQINRHVQKRQGIDAGMSVLLVGVHKLFDDNASLNNLEDWVRTTPLVHLKGMKIEELTPGNINYVFDKLMDESEYFNALEQIQIRLFEIAKKEFNLNKKELYYDITSTYFEGSCCELSRFGYSRDHRRDKRQINIGLLLAKDKSFPVLTKVFPGNISDKKTVIEIATTIKYIYHFDDVIAVMDRGMSSADNIQVLDANEYDYVLGLSSVSKEVQKLKDAFSRLKIKRKGEKFLSKKGIEMHALKCTRNLFGKRRTLVLIYNEDSAQEQIETMESAIERAQKAFAETKNSNRKNTEAIKKLGAGFVDIIKQKEHHELLVNEEKRKNLLKRAGKSVLLSTLPLSAAETVKFYFSKDAVEKAFKFSKHYGNLRPIRRRIKDRVKVDIFISFLGYYLIAFIKSMLKRKGYDITFEKLMKELPRIKGVIRRHQKKNKKHVEIICQNNTQQKLMELMEMEKTFKELVLNTTSQK